jgi:hypothetical protein
MAGRVKALIDELLQLRAKGVPSLEHYVKANLALNGIDPEQYTETSADIPTAVLTLERMIQDYRSQQQ